MRAVLSATDIKVAYIFTDWRMWLYLWDLVEGFLREYRKEVPFVKDDIVMYKEIHKTVAFLSRTKFDY